MHVAQHLNGNTISTTECTATIIQQESPQHEGSILYLWHIYILILVITIIMKIEYTIEATISKQKKEQVNNKKSKLAESRSSFDHQKCTSSTQKYTCEKQGDHNCSHHVAGIHIVTWASTTIWFESLHSLSHQDTITAASHLSWVVKKPATKENKKHWVSILDVTWNILSLAFCAYPEASSTECSTAATQAIVPMACPQSQIILTDTGNNDSVSQIRNIKHLTCLDASFWHHDIKLSNQHAHAKKNILQYTSVSQAGNE